MADAADVLADRLEAELGVEGGDAVDLRQRHARLLADAGDALAREVAVLGLHLLQQRDEPAFLAGVVQAS